MEPRKSLSETLTTFVTKTRLEATIILAGVIVVAAIVLLALHDIGEFGFVSLLVVALVAVKGESIVALAKAKFGKSDS